MPQVLVSKPNSFAFRSQFYRFNWQGALIGESQNKSDVRWTDAVSRFRGPSFWKKAIADGNCATTLMSGSGTTFDCEGGSFSASTRAPDSQILPPAITTLNTYTGYGHFFSSGGSPTINDASYASARSESLTRFYANLASVESRFKGLTFSGELKKTLSTLRSPFKALRSGLDTYLGIVQKNTRRTRREKRLAMVRDTWLEWSYAVRPLISDCSDAVDSFYASKAIKPLHQMVRGSASVRYNKVIAIDAHYFDWGNARIRGTTVDTSEISVRHYGTYVSRGNGISDPGSFGFSPEEFVPTLYELIPYSFLVDYFSNVGKVLESWSYRFLGPNFISEGSKRSAIRTVTGKIQNVAAVGITVSTCDGKAGTYVRTDWTLARTPDIGNPLPSLTLKIPGNWSQWANMAALAAKSQKVTKVLLGP